MSFLSSLEGRLFEGKVLCTCTCKYDNYLPYKVAVKEVKKNQPKRNLSDPAMRKLYYLISNELGISNLLYYTAINSPLDLYHGVDCFFEYNNVIITLDLKTSSRYDNEDVKANICLSADTLYCNGAEYGEVNIQALTIKAKEIALSFKEEFLRRSRAEQKEASFKFIKVETVVKMIRRKKNTVV